MLVIDDLTLESDETHTISFPETSDNVVDISDMAYKALRRTPNRKSGGKFQKIANTKIHVFLTVLEHQ